MERSKKPVRIGVVGCGLVAQVMHLPYLAELREQFRVVALCDLSPAALAHGGRQFPEAALHLDWRDLVDSDLDAVLVATPGSHAPIAIAAARAGRHVLVEKPMCIEPGEGREMIAAAEQAGVTLMVGYMKRYDPAYEELNATLDRTGLSFARITTLESPLAPYVSHYPLTREADADPDLLAELAADDARRVTLALGTDDELTRRVYRDALLDSVIHELNGVQGLLGPPTTLHSARIWGEPHGVSFSLSFGSIESNFAWIDLPGIARYEQDWSFYGPNGRASLIFPSPFLRNAVTELVREAGDGGTPTAWRTSTTVAFDEAFKRELVHFHDCVTGGVAPRTGGEEGLRDVLLCQAIAQTHLETVRLSEAAA